MALLGGGNHAEKVAFAQDHAMVQQNVEGRGDVKIEIRQREACQELARRELHRLLAQWKVDYALLRGREGVCGMPADIRQRISNTFLHIPKRLVRILRGWGFLSKYASNCAPSRIAGIADLSAEGEHIRIKRRRVQRGRR